MNRDMEMVTLIRHDETAHHARQLAKMQYPVYVAFRAAYDKNKESATTYQLAKEVAATISTDFGEFNIPLLEDRPKAESRAAIAAAKLMTRIPLPNRIYVSPTSRSIKTLERMQSTWPDLRLVPTNVENLIRERDLGLAWLFPDIKVFEVLNPEQAALKHEHGDYKYVFPSGESIVDVRNRVDQWTKGLEADPVTHTLAIGHRVGILSFRANVEGLDEEGYKKLDQSVEFADAGTTIYERNNLHTPFELKQFNIPVEKLEEVL